MFGNGLYIITIESVYDYIKRSRTLLVPATDQGQANIRVAAYLMDLNWPDAYQWRKDRLQWYISQELREIDLYTLMGSPGPVAIVEDIKGSVDKYIPATLEDSIAFKEEGDINPDTGMVEYIDPCSCLDCEEDLCLACLFDQIDPWYQQDDEW
jgi:hypothetical protein